MTTDNDHIIAVILHIFAYNAHLSLFYGTLLNLRTIEIGQRIHFEQY